MISIKKMINLLTNKFSNIDHDNDAGHCLAERIRNIERLTDEVGIKEVSWLEYELANPSGNVTERSMLTFQEIAVLFLLAKECYTGEGEIVDLGPLLGVGTNALSRGLKKNAIVRQKSKRIHVFDLFLAKGMGQVISESSRSGAVLDRFYRNNRDYMDEISVSAGNLLDFSWDRSPIEILFVDIAKSWPLNEYVIQQFFSCLIPGKSIVIQQDYVYFAEYWIPITMEFFADYFEFLCFIPGSSAVYKYKKEIPGDLLYVKLAQLSLEYKMAAFHQAQEKTSPSVREILKCGQAYCLLENGDFDRAQAVLESVEFPVAITENEADFNPAIPSNFKVVNDLLHQASGKKAAFSGGADYFQNTDNYIADLQVVLSVNTVSSRDIIKGQVFVRNIGQTTWSLDSEPVGVVNLGAHLFNNEGVLVNYDYFRSRIGPESLRTLAHGDDISFDIEIQAPVYGSYVLEFDLVSEMVCWFEKNGSKTVKIPIVVVS